MAVPMAFEKVAHWAVARAVCSVAQLGALMVEHSDERSAEKKAAYLVGK